jgi:hypothetical protein
MIKSRWIIRVDHVACMGEKRNTYTLLMRKYECKRLLGRRHQTGSSINKMTGCGLASCGSG